MEQAMTNAHRILDQLVKHDQKVSLQKMTPLVKGVAMITEPECEETTVMGPDAYGIIFTKKQGEEEEEYHWSDPYGCKLSGLGWGVGGASKDIIVFILDDKSLESFISSPTGLELNEGASLAVGSYDNDAAKSSMVGSHFVSKSDTGLANNELLNSTDADGNNNNNLGGGVGTLCIAFTSGTYVSATANGAAICPSHEISQEFYGKKVNMKDILLAKTSSSSSEQKTLVDNKHKLYADLQSLYKKLDNLSDGKKSETTTKGTIPREAPAAIADIVGESISTY